MLKKYKRVIIKEKITYFLKKILMPHFDDDKQQKKLDTLRLREEEDLARMLASKYGILYIDLSVVSIDSEALRTMMEEDARKALIAPFHIVGKKLFVAVHSPKNEQTVFAINELEKKGFNIILYITSMASLTLAWERYKELSFAQAEKAGILEISNTDILYFLEQQKTIDDFKNLVNEMTENKEKVHQVSRILEMVLAGAMASNASDIHIEPSEKRARLRLRLDGVLQDIAFFDARIFKLVLSRVKLVSGMKLNIDSIAQDGRFSVVLNDTEIEIRSSVLPGTYGEAVVMRLLNPNIINIPFSALGIDEALRKEIEKQIAKPNGLILTTGPTGSGKTTSLYAFMREIYTPEVKIITIENPIEYHLPGIVQTQTDEKKGYTFLAGLRSALRQDPDIIMVGEIRDTETAHTAMDAALTGHLVFSTLHTNNAAGAIPRLIGLGVNPKIIGGALNIALAQRLLRLLCVKCKKEDVQSVEERKIIDDIVGNIYGRKVENHGKIWRAVGCPACSNTGFKGQMGIYEGVIVNAAIEALLDKNPSDREIKKVAHEQGLLDMREDGIVKVLNGVTSLDELYRIVDMSGER
ncbi:MAG: type II/IV secretion system protein [Candidatus Parcubacteria bacterium]|nr:type II/IV secretion system protein [Candidatus Parcubacteria bacterium]